MLHLLLKCTRPRRCRSLNRWRDARCCETQQRPTEHRPVSSEGPSRSQAVWTRHGASPSDCRRSSRCEIKLLRSTQHELIIECINSSWSYCTKKSVFVLNFSSKSEKNKNDWMSSTLFKMRVFSQQWHKRATFEISFLFF